METNHHARDRRAFGFAGSIGSESCSLRIDAQVRRAG